MTATALKVEKVAVHFGGLVALSDMNFSVGEGEIVQKGVSKFSADLKPGKYTYICEVEGHEAGGMKGTLTVK